MPKITCRFRAEAIIRYSSTQIDQFYDETSFALQIPAIPVTLRILITLCIIPL